VISVRIAGERVEVADYGDFVVANVAEFAASLSSAMINHSKHWSPVSNQIT